MKSGGKMPGVTGKKGGAGMWGSMPGKTTPGKSGKGTGKFMSGAASQSKGGRKMGCKSCGSM